MLSFLVFGAPTLNPNGTVSINVLEGTSDSLFCFRSPDTAFSKPDISTQLCCFRIERSASSMQVCHLAYNYTVTH